MNGGPAPFRPSCPPSRQQGAAALVTVLVLLLVLALATAHTSRDLALDQQAARNLHRAMLASEAAEAGLDWTLAQLQAGGIDHQCRPLAAAPTHAAPSPGPSSGPSSPSGPSGPSGPATSNDARFQQRYLRPTPDGGLAPAPQADGRWLAGCIQAGSQGWRCACPPLPASSAAGPAGPGAPQNATPESPFPPGLDADPGADRLQPAFGIQIAAVAHSALLRVTSRGCSHGLAACSDRQARLSDGLGQAEVAVDLAPLSALPVPPGSPLIAVGNVDLQSGAGARNHDASTGALVLQAGGQLSGDLSQLFSLPGTPAGQALLTGDSELARIPLFRSFFGQTPEQYRQQPALHRLQCQAQCGPAVRAAVDQGHQLLWLEGGATLNGAGTLGRPDRPVLLVVTGPLAIQGPLQIHGLVHARGSATWHNASTQPASLQGALLTEGSLSLSGRVDLQYSGNHLARLRQLRVGHVRVPGSWHAVHGGAP